MIWVAQIVLAAVPEPKPHGHIWQICNWQMFKCQVHANSFCKTTRGKSDISPSLPCWSEKDFQKSSLADVRAQWAFFVPSLAPFGVPVKFSAPAAGTGIVSNLVQPLCWVRAGAGMKWLLCSHICIFQPLSRLAQVCFLLSSATGLLSPRPDQLSAQQDVNRLFHPCHLMNDWQPVWSCPFILKRQILSVVESLLPTEPRVWDPHPLRLGPEPRTGGCHNREAVVALAMGSSLHISPHPKQTHREARTSSLRDPVRGIRSWLRAPKNFSMKSKNFSISCFLNGHYQTLSYFLMLTVIMNYGAHRLTWAAVLPMRENQSSLLETSRSPRRQWGLLLTHQTALWPHSRKVWAKGWDPLDWSGSSAERRRCHIMRGERWKKLDVQYPECFHAQAQHWGRALERIWQRGEWQSIGRVRGEGSCTDILKNNFWGDPGCTVI